MATLVLKDFATLPQICERQTVIKTRYDSRVALIAIFQSVRCCQCDQMARLSFDIWPITPFFYKKIALKQKIPKVGSIIFPMRNEGLKN